MIIKSPRRLFAVAALLAVTAAGGCESGYSKFYSQVAPKTFEASSDVEIYRYSNADLDLIYDWAFGEYMIIGRANFNGPWENPTRARAFARSIGADVLISTSAHESTVHSVSTLQTPTTTTTPVYGDVNGTPVYGSMTSSGMTTTVIPTTVHRYNHDGLFLRNVDGVVPWWRKTESEFSPSLSRDDAERWVNADLDLRVYRTPDALVGFLAAPSALYPEFAEGDQILHFRDEWQGSGMLRRSNGSPGMAEYELDRFGHLSVRSLMSDFRIAFEKTE